MATKQKKLPIKFLFKVGDDVRWVRRNGEAARGRVAGSDRKANGVWVAVNLAPKGKNPQIIRVQQARLARA